MRHSDIHNVPRIAVPLAAAVAGALLVPGVAIADESVDTDAGTEAIEEVVTVDSSEEEVAVVVDDSAASAVDVVSAVEAPVVSEEETSNEDAVVAEVPADAEDEVAADEDVVASDAATAEIVADAATDSDSVAPDSEDAIISTNDGESTAVAQVGDVTYDNFDDAVSAATQGDNKTIELLTDTTTAGLNLRSDLTIKGNGHSLTFTQYGIALWGKTLTLDNVKASMAGIGSTPATGDGWTWMTICTSQNAVINLVNGTSLTMDGSGTKSGTAGIFFSGHNQLNITDSTLEIRNYSGNALAWDGGNPEYTVSIVNSKYVSDHNRSGFTGTFDVTIDNSIVEVTNSRGNGSNGSQFTIKNGSDVTFSGNTDHGLSASSLVVEDSTLTAEGNGRTGIIFTRASSFTNSTVTVSGTKGISYWNAGIRLYTANSSFTVDKGTTLTVSGNKVTGIFMDSGSSLTIEEGADVTITGNVAAQENCSSKMNLAQSGGGIVVRSGATAAVASSAKIYDNLASYAGDDIYVEAGGSIAFGEVNSDGTLDYAHVGEEDGHVISGWFDDSADSRWNADLESGNNYVKSVEAGTYSGALAVKAAHGLLVKYVWVSDENRPTSPFLSRRTPTSTPAMSTRRLPRRPLARDTPSTVGLPMPSSPFPGMTP